MLRFLLWALTAAQWGSTAAQWAWNVAMTANPVGIVIVAVAALVAGLVLLWTQYDRITAATDRWSGRLGPLGSALRGIMDIVGALKGELNFEIGGARRQAVRRGQRRHLTWRPRIAAASRAVERRRVIVLVERRQPQSDEHSQSDAAHRRAWLRPRGVAPCVEGVRAGRVPDGARRRRGRHRRLDADGDARGGLVDASGADLEAIDARNGQAGDGSAE